MEFFRMTSFFPPRTIHSTILSGNHDTDFLVQGSILLEFRERDCTRDPSKLARLVDFCFLCRVQFKHLLSVILSISPLYFLHLTWDYLQIFTHIIFAALSKYSNNILQINSPFSSCGLRVSLLDSPSFWAPLCLTLSLCVAGGRARGLGFRRPGFRFCH